MRKLHHCQFGAVTFVGGGNDDENDDDEKVGPNGLPLTPTSVRMLGRFQLMRTIEHAHLVRYLDLVRGKCNDRVIIIAEHYSQSVADLLIDEHSKQLSIIDQLTIGRQLVDALVYLHDRQVVNAYLSARAVLICSLSPLYIRLSQYGLYYTTDRGANIDFPLVNPWYMAPERLALSADDKRPHGSKIDIWAFGIFLLEMNIGIELRSIWGVRQIFGVLMSAIIKAEVLAGVNIVFIGRDGSLLGALLDSLRVAKPERNFAISVEVSSLIEQCLMIMPSSRPNARTLLHLLTVDCKDKRTRTMDDIFRCLSSGRDSPVSSLEYIKDDLDANGASINSDPLFDRPIDEVYYLWRLAGSTVEKILTKCGMIKVRPPIEMLPMLVRVDGRVVGNEESRRQRVCLDVTALPMNNIRERVQSVDICELMMSLEMRFAHESTMVDDSDWQLSAVVKERSIQYQLHRMSIIGRLLLAYPYKVQWLLAECRKDIPPVYRAYAWAAILNVRGDVDAVYNDINVLNETPTDRQLDVDIPRCHQYDELMASPTAHAKMKRVLKALLSVTRQHGIVYWQGLDSLTAPFVYLNFNNEALAFASLKAFIARFMHRFFLRDNSAVIQEYLCVFNHLIAFVDPQLHTHLRDIDFHPELYTIPWFLTMFAHVLPLHKLMHLWDSLLLHDGSFALFVGVAILRELRHRLIDFGFNECILLFSDLPDIDVERCVACAKTMYELTPKSCTHRVHASPADQKPDMQSLSVDELKRLPCARLSAADLFALSPDRLLMIDVRPCDQFNRGAVPSSVNIPLGTDDNHQLISDLLHRRRQRHHAKVIICVMDGGEMRSAITFARHLIDAHFARVCLLDRGVVQILKQTSVLTVRCA